MEKLLCGVDLGGTKLSVGLIYADGRIHDKITVYDHIGKNEIMIVDQIRRLMMACACGLALPQLFKKKTELGIRTTLPLPDNFNYSQVDGKMIKKGLDIGDPLSKAIFEECADYIGIAV